MNALDLANAILALKDVSPQDLAALKRAVRYQAEQYAYHPKLYDTVRFNAKTRGIKEGTVIKINPKTCKVRVGQQVWNVSTNLLSKV